MSTRPNPERSGAVEIATRRRPRLRVLWDLRELTHQQKPGLWSLPFGLGPVTVHPTRWGAGPHAFWRQVLFPSGKRQKMCLMCPIWYNEGFFRASLTA